MFGILGFYAGKLYPPPLLTIFSPRPSLTPHRPVIRTLLGPTARVWGPKLGWGIIF